jgi:dTDP-glucose 4,6-dehydratase
MRVLVTGGAGFIGSEFVRSALRDSYSNIGFKVERLTVIDALTYAGNLSNLDLIKNDSRFNFIHGDIRNFELIQRLVRDVDLVINFAAETHVDRSISNAEDFISTNVFGTYNILEAARIAGNVRVLQVSTDEVYGSISKGSSDEDSPLLPNSPYSASKASGDLLVRAFRVTYGLDTVLTRCSNNYGPFQNPEKFIPLLITNLLAGKKLPIYGTGNNIREWIHVSDHARAIALVALKGKSGEILNVGGRNEFTNLEIAYKLLNIFEAKSSKIEFVSDRLGHDFRYSLNDKKIRALGYEDITNFDKGLLDTVSWYENNKQALGHE